MKTALIAALALSFAASSARAVEFAAPAAKQLYTCAGGTLSRVAQRQDAAPEPAPCCTGMFGCPQLLANTGLVKPKRSNRT